MMTGKPGSNFLRSKVGSGYVNSANAVGAWTEVTISVPSTGMYTLDFHYANGGT